MRSHPRGDYNIDDLAKKIPNNKWIPIVKSLRAIAKERANRLTQTEKESVAKNFEAKIKGRVEGKDIN